jgi:hypothetical protein
MENLSNLKIANALSALVQLDVNAAKAYEEAIANMDVISLRQQYLRFRDVHNEHVLNLKKVIRALDVVPPESSQDLKGLLMESWSAIRGSTGVEGALKAMKTNMEYVDKKYREACALPLSPNIMGLVEHNYQEVHSQLQFLEKAIAGRIWEQ